MKLLLRSFNLLFSDVLVAVAVVVLFNNNSLILRNKFVMFTYSDDI